MASKMADQTSCLDQECTCKTCMMLTELKLLDLVSASCHNECIMIHFKTLVFASWQGLYSPTEPKIISSADPKVSSAELMVLLIVHRPSSSVRQLFALNRYSSYSSYSIILNFLLEKLGI